MRLMNSSTFLRRSRITTAPTELSQVINSLSAFLLPVTDALRSDGSFNKAWRPPGPWA
ncbi:hypothetical protein J7M28_09270 [bacterium]|nr:hypothetical protein [bacterium]